MRRSKEIMILFALFIIMAAGVLWYVIDRRAKNRAVPPVATRPLAPELPAAKPAPPNEPVALGGENERKTIDFSTGKPVVKDTPEDKAALEAGLKDIANATKDVTFEPEKPAEAAKK
ncbi:MAG: hypothetical protein WDM96_11655 [Lacunisphaera sp.]